jgi:hypothetical protein
MCTFVLQEMEVAADNIKRENFLIAQPKPIKALPPDSRLHFAHIKFREKKYAIQVHYPDSILAAARKKALSYPTVAKQEDVAIALLNAQRDMYGSPTMRSLRKRNYQKR